jgi:hypothetical protein
MKAVLSFVVVIVGLYFILSWAANNPASVKQIHNKVDNTVEKTVDKGSRAAGELAK